VLCLKMMQELPSPPPPPSTTGEVVSFSMTMLLTGRQPVLRPFRTRSRQRNLLVWFVAIACLIFNLVLIFLATTTLITYLVVRPNQPTFGVQIDRLNGIYFDSNEFFNGDVSYITNLPTPTRRWMSNSNEFFNGDVSYITNFTNPNKNMDVLCLKMMQELPLPPPPPSTTGEVVPFSMTMLLTGRQTVLRPFHTRSRQRNLLVWFVAIACLIFSLVLIFLATTTLITYLVVRPNQLVFGVQNDRLNGNSLTQMSSSTKTYPTLQTSPTPTRRWMSDSSKSR
ncbi:hypothetical protein LINPERHAP1_LOCUS22745, partial [Linum perenne]